VWFLMNIYQNVKKNRTYNHITCWFVVIGQDAGFSGAPAKKYDIKTFGAVGDGKTLNTEKMHVRLWSWWSSYG
jgi:hypothetical protein